MDTKRIIIQSDLSELDKVRNFISDISPQFNIDKKQSFNIALAVDEACTNIIKYSHNEILEKEIIIEATKSNNELIIRIFDEGEPFDPSEAKLPDLETHIKKFTRGGLGIHIIRNLVDNIIYHPKLNTNQNVLELRKMI
jgi:serine/threonine-protein kinase RsbW